MDIDLYPPVEYPAEPGGLRFTEDWCTPRERTALTVSWNRVENLSGYVIEVGCFEGQSAVFTANLIWPEILTCVDPWTGTPYAEYEIAAYANRPIKDNFDFNIEHGTMGNVDVHQMGYEEFFADFDGPIKFLYLDGPHGYDDVVRGLELITPLLIPGGVIIGDNYEDVSVKAAVKDFFGEELEHPRSDRAYEWIKP